MSDSPALSSFRLVGIVGGLTAQPSPSCQPVATLVRWRLLRASTGSHLVGYCLERNEGRVSSAVMSIDPATRRAATASGRIYVLSGPSGHDADAAWVWEQVAADNGSTEVEDLTGELDAELGRAEEPR